MRGILFIAAAAAALLLSSYTPSIAQAVKCPAPTQTEIGLVESACRENVISIYSRSGILKLGKGQDLCFEPPGEEWFWYCGASRERAQCKGTKLVRAEKAADGRTIIWTCF